MQQPETNPTSTIMDDDDALAIGTPEARTFDQPTATAVAQDGSELLVDEPDTTTAKPAAADLKSRIQGLKDPARQKAQAIFDDLKTRTGPQREQAEAFVRQKPYTSIGIAVLGGMILSKLLRR